MSSEGRRSKGQRQGGRDRNLKKFANRLPKNELLNVRDRVPAACSLRTLVQRVQRAHRLIVEIEVEHVSILDDSNRSVGFGKRDCGRDQRRSEERCEGRRTVALLEAPADEDLGGSLGDLGES